MSFISEIEGRVECEAREGVIDYDHYRILARNERRLAMVLAVRGFAAAIRNAFGKTKSAARELPANCVADHY